MLIAKTICAMSISYFSISSKTIFSTSEDFEHLSMKKDPFNQIIRKWQPEGVFVGLLENI